MSGMSRELGVDNTECPNCGNTLAAVEQADGATAYETCSNCYPAATAAGGKSEPEQANYQVDDVFANREFGTHDDQEGSKDV